jgi:hypothetical protein
MARDLATGREAGFVVLVCCFSCVASLRCAAQHGRGQPNRPGVWVLSPNLVCTQDYVLRDESAVGPDPGSHGEGHDSSARGWRANGLDQPGHHVLGNLHANGEAGNGTDGVKGLARGGAGEGEEPVAPGLVIRSVKGFRWAEAAAAAHAQQQEAEAAAAAAAAASARRAAALRRLRTFGGGGSPSGDGWAAGSLRRVVSSGQHLALVSPYLCWVVLVL